MSKMMRIVAITKVADRNSNTAYRTCIPFDSSITIGDYVTVSSGDTVYTARVVYDWRTNLVVKVKDDCKVPVPTVEKIEDPHNTITKIIHNNENTVVFFADGTKSVTTYTSGKVGYYNASEGEIIAILKRYLPHGVFRTLMKSLDKARMTNRKFYHSSK